MARFGVSKPALWLALMLLGACGGRTLDPDAYDVYDPSLGAGNGASGGAAPGSAGAPSNGGNSLGGSEVDGSTGGSPVSQAGSSQGGAHSVGGGPAQACGAPPHANGSLTLIDDMEEHQGFINQYEGRKGSWFAFNDGTPGGDQFPSPGASPFPMHSIGRDATGGQFAASSGGSDFITWGAGIGAELNDGCPYDASVYKGLHFFARGEDGDTLLVRIPTASAYTSFNGTCASNAEPCSDVYQTEIVLKRDWQEYYIAFDTLRPANHAGGAGFDASTLLRLEFEAPPASSFAFWIDALTFF